MGFFDLFKGKKSEGKDKPRVAQAARWAERAADKRAQSYDRQEAIQALAQIVDKWVEKAQAEAAPDAARSPAAPTGGADFAEGNEVPLSPAEFELQAAVGALLRRFTFATDPSITDQEEKDTCFTTILKAGNAGLPAVRAFAAKAESLAWPMRIFKEMLSEDAYVGELLGLLEKWDTEYAKFIDPKIQLLAALEDHTDDRVFEVVRPFLLDVNEDARFHAVCTLLRQKADGIAEDLVSTLIDEESLRIKMKICDGLMVREVVIPEDQRNDVRKSLPSGFTIDGAGLLRKREGAVMPFDF
jgi:hypothetical protein